jgi:hypothetical protein
VTQLARRPEIFIDVSSTPFRVIRTMSSHAPAPRRVGRRSASRSPHGPAGGGLARSRRLFAGGTDGNERLTTLTGLLLFVLTAAIGVTIIWIGQLIWLHLFLGLLLLGPVALKLASTGYRFVRYYTGNERYRRKGPPVPLLRGLAPFVVACTVALYGTGVALLFAGRHTALPLGLLHKISFFAWIAFTGVHVLGHLPEILRVLRSAPATRRQLTAIEIVPADGDTAGGRVDGAVGRAAALAVSLVAGAALATALIGQFSVWTH